nr:hypothetical protein [Dendronalium sp. ChiSLP03b]
MSEQCSTVWIVPIFAPIIGALIGALTYDLLIGRVLEREHTKQAYRQQLTQID